mgnify:CR=1 FL=1
MYGCASACWRNGGLLSSDAPLRGAGTLRAGGVGTKNGEAERTRLLGRLGPAMAPLAAVLISLACVANALLETPATLAASPLGSPLSVLAGLIAFHILIIIASNYLVQLPITLFGYHTTWGAFSFPFIFLATDLTVRLLGKQAARRVIARVMLPALVASYVVSVVFQEGSYRGIDALLSFNDFVLRISLASFVAYVIGQLLDIQVFDRLRRIKAWWIAPSLSTVLGNLADTFAFFSVAFWSLLPSPRRQDITNITAAFGSVLHHTRSNACGT